MSVTVFIPNLNHMTNKWGKKVNWPTISTRISPEMREKLLMRHPNDGDVTKVLQALLTRYLDGKIIGIKIEA